MKAGLKKNLASFQKWGAKGGKKRAQTLSSSQRQHIARQAALKRWQTQGKRDISLPSVRLDEGRFSDPVYVEEVLLYGNVNAWKELRRLIADRPFGVESVALKKVLERTHIYGVTPLWKRMLKQLQGDFS
ncbi:MAG: hypothetical protein A3I05_04000 [Deltaproteobacteria bacterium RIFCSPLOWO2_02_FULL_44_10]|nr:MAG: hypothetical protein A3C46_03845 [Deltaproteobacteria bacterium RIFCSPHIGHO2_02_FULL_44_16]OGQ46311.1 MAG: hypothetical protein A3I05_04000 [Deltaproteobacteria bacterium RIFCSPLOWO2_02_FULL_44_10]